ncbi:pseudouridine synthase [Paenibacillus thermoaerophilus]|uniref:Pseudouridine synthase n=1 Tax=Paenibacillus thermoaerophilus TaxID=1215385 RepID=A0ABW2VB54_9BACL|nr:pseudouridine synthase [Paenibacillus thermoaerophilus]TMV07509.1 rRNA pseudouridine synthase [Paenibacillus thermoaerophilus]
MEERLQKVLAQAGVASRRKCEEYILAGRVKVNGLTVNTLGTKVDPNKDEIRVDDKPIRSQDKVYLMLYKPKGYISSVTDPRGRRTVMDLVKSVGVRVYPVGRLDYDSEGLLIMTNDGEFANALTHPRHHVPKTYLATVKGVPHGSQLEKLAAGIELEDGVTAPAEVEYQDVDLDANESVIRITIYEGRNRQVRRMFEAIGCTVVRLKRIAIGPLQLGGLSRGKHRPLTPQEINELKQSANQTHKFQKRG